MIPINYEVSTTIAVEMQDNRGKTRRVRFKSGINRNYIKIRVESVRFFKKGHTCVPVRVCVRSSTNFNVCISGALKNPCPFSRPRFWRPIGLMILMKVSVAQTSERRLTWKTCGVQFWMVIAYFVLLRFHTIGHLLSTVL